MAVNNSFLIGIASSIVATILTSFVWFFWNKFKQRDILLTFLGLDMKKEALLYYGNVQKYSQPRSDERPRKDYTTIEYGDITSALLLFDRIKPSLSAKVKHSVGNDMSISSRGNIITIGGPKWNRMTEYLIGKLGSPLYFRQGASGVLEKRRMHQNENQYSPEVNRLSDDLSKVKDYGFVICARSCFLGNEIPFAMIVAGSSSLGVLIATEFVTSLNSSTIRTIKKRLGDDKRFGFLIEGIVEVASDGRYIGSTLPHLMALIPEQDFLDPYLYEYHN